MGDGVAFDPFPLFDDGLATSEVDIGVLQVVDALVAALAIVVIDEDVDPGFERPPQVLVLQQDAVLQGLVPALDLPLGLWVVGRAAHMLHAFAFQPGGEIG